MKYLFLFLLVCSSTLVSCQNTILPEPTGVVNDFENIFTEEEKEDLTNIILEFENITSNEIAIASIKSIDGYDDFDKYSLDLSNYWGVGKKEKDNGLTIFFSTKLRQIRINTGTKTQLIVNDAFCKKVVDDIMLPEFKQKNYFQGTKNALLALIAEWKK